MEDERTFLEREISVARDAIGRDPEPDDFVREFAKLDPTQRVMKLDQLNASIQSRELSIHQAAREYRYVRALRDTHDILRKVNR
jgi:hypothetical protein